MKLILGDSLQKLKDLPTSTVDAIVTDPPYGWRFMGKAWDGEDIEKTIKNKARKGEQYEADATRIGKAQSAGLYDTSYTANQYFMHWTYDWAQEALRVLKPGGHMVVFCGPRTYHAMAMGVEMAGFEIRDQLQWLFGSGFPKSLDVSKAIDKAAGAEREVIGTAWEGRGKGGNQSGTFENRGPGLSGEQSITAPATDDARKWDGFGTALKPANEPICLARKPLEKGLTVAQNVLKWGTGALSIDACRVGSEARQSKTMKSGTGDTYGKYDEWDGAYKSVTGRWPANVLFDEVAAQALDAQTAGTRASKPSNTGTKFKATGAFPIESEPVKYDESEVSGASRFFYVAKASKRERNLGIPGTEYALKSDAPEWVIEKVKEIVDKTAV